MKLPEDLIKATDYSKTKDREIKEFEYINGKYIHHYVLGGEHELKPQEIVDCLNAIATIDCDLQTAYAYIQGQKDKVAELEAKLAESEKEIKVYEEIVEQKDEELNFANRDKTCIVKQLNDPKAYVLLEDYKRIEQQLAEKEKEIEQLKFQINVKDGENAELERRIYELDGNGFCTGECWCCDYYKESNDGYSVCTYKAHQDKISFAVGKLEEVKEICKEIPQCDEYGDDWVHQSSLFECIDNKIKAIKGEK